MEENTLDIDRSLIEIVLFESGRPVVVVPSGKDAFAARRIIVAWDGSAMVVRAVADAMAFLQEAEMIIWLCQHGIMPLYTPPGGSWLNMAESIQRILKRRALDGQHPGTPTEIGAWFEQTAQAWNRKPTPFVWNGKRRQRRRKRGGDQHAVGGSATNARQPLSKRCGLNL